MPAMAIVVDADAVKRVFQAAPAAAVKRMLQLIEGETIDLQRKIRETGPIHDGEYRRSVKYTIDRRDLSGEVGPRVKYAKWVEEGTRPHWTSVKEGTPLRKWADDKGINPWMVQRAIARKGTKEQRVVTKVYNFNHRLVNRNIASGMAKFAQELDRGQI